MTPIKKINILILLLSITGFSFAQQIEISGVVRDSLQQPLVNANIIAVSKAQEGLQFAITNEQGAYKLRLYKDYNYTITASYLGFHKQETNYLATKDTILNYSLKENKEQLDEVVLTQPVIVKQDTLIYDADSFTNGKERKLKQVLEKLPGVEVDRKGNVTVQGKKVKKILVEGRRFFTGDPKLGVNNIPANAVDKIEVLDNHSDVAFLKGLEDSEDMAMNIKLKEDKKQFVFGDIEAATGVAENENYLLHPSLFYYSPKTNVNLLVDANNIGTKSFTLKEYLEYEGGFSKLAKNANEYFSLYNSDFANFLSAQDFKASKHLFGAFNITQTLTKKTDLSAYAIASSTQNQTQVNNFNNYVLENNAFTEQRSQTGDQKNNFGLGKLSLTYKPTSKTEVYLTSSAKTTNNQANSLVNTISTNSNQIQTSNQLDNLNLKQNIELHSQFNNKHTVSATANYQYQKSNPLNNWLTNQELLAGLLPIQTQSLYNINQLQHTNTHNLAVIAKHYWVLNRFNHLYTTMGSNYTAQGLSSNEFQVLQDNNVNNFSTSGFGYKNSYRFNNSYIGIHYKFKKGIVVIKPGLFWHKYNWSPNKELVSNQQKSYILPELTSKIELKKSEKITAKYKLVARFANPNQLINNYTLRGFNGIFIGNENLENTLNHQASLNYYKFSLYKGIFIHSGITFRKKIKNIQSNTSQQGIDQINSLVATYNPETIWNVYCSFSKTISNFKLGVNTNYNQNSYTQLLTIGNQENQSKNTTIGLSFKTKFEKKYPNINIKHEHRYSNFESGTNNSQFLNKETLFELDYIFLKDFELKADYSYTDYRNKEETTKNYFNLANASLFYQQENSPWGFELTASNLFDIKFKTSNSFSSIIISDTKTFVLPRIISLKVAYKL